MESRCSFILWLLFVLSNSRRVFAYKRFAAWRSLPACLCLPIRSKETKCKDIFFRFALVAIVAVSGGCSKHEPDFSGKMCVRIVFDWSFLKGKQPVPTRMQLRFYDESGSFLFSRCSGADVYQGRLPVGRYRVLIYNPDMPGVGFRNLDNYREAEIYSLTRQPGSAGSVPAAYSGDNYGTAIENFTVSAVQPTDTTLLPHTYVRAVALQVATGESMQDVVGCAVSVGGLYGAMNLSSGLPVPGTDVTLYGELEPKGNRYEGMLRLMGPGTKGRNVLTLELRFADGTRKTFTKNITSFLEMLADQPGLVEPVIEFDVDVNAIGVWGVTLTDWVGRHEEMEIN